MNLPLEINKAFDGMIDTLSSINDNEIDTIPFDNSWTAGQVAEHIIKSAGNIPQFFSENVELIERPMGEKEDEIKEVFLDYSIKMESPDFIVPSSGKHNNNELIDDLKKLKKEAVDAAEKMDLAWTCKSFEFPGWGFLTRYEWLVFIACHVQRHTHQLKNVKQALNEKLSHFNTSEK